MFRKTKRFIRNIKLWYPILLEDESWDSHYLYVVIEHKLKLMEDMFRGENTYTADILIYAEEIKECRRLLARLIKDDYMSEEASKYYKETGIESINKPTSEHRRELTLKWAEEEENAKQKDKDRLFQLLNTHIDNWWD